MVKKKSFFTGVPRTGKRDPTQDALTENIEVLTGQRGNELNKALLWRDLVNLDDMKRRALIGSINSNNNGGLPIVSGGIERPHAPVNLQGVGGFTFIALTWDHPTYKGHAYAEIYRSETDDFSSAIRIATEVTDIFSDSVNMGSKYFYWVRFVNKADMKGPVHSAAGLYVESMQSAATILAELGGKIENSHLGDFLQGEVGQIPSLAFDIDQARLAANEVLASNDGLAIDLINSSLENDGNWQTVKDQVVAIANIVDSNYASIELSYYTKVATDAAITLKTETLESKIIDPEGISLGATLQQLSYTTASNYGKFTAMWGVRTDVNDITSSFGLLNDGVDPIFAIKGAKFAIITTQDPEVLTPVFAVIDDKTVIKSALIDEAHIQSLVTDELLSNRIVVGSKLTTPSINYDPVTGERSQNFSLSPNGILHTKSAVMEGITIKDAEGNVVMSSTGAIPSGNISGLGSLATADSIGYNSLTGKPTLGLLAALDGLSYTNLSGKPTLGPFAGLDKILSTNVTTYIASGAIGSAQINQAYIETLFGIDASFLGTVYAEKIQGDLVDGDVVSVSASAASVTSAWSTIKTITVERNVNYDVWLTIDDLVPTMDTVSGFGALYTRLKYSVQTGKAVSISSGSANVQVEIQVKKIELYNGETPVDTRISTQNAILQMFRKSSGFIV